MTELPLVLRGVVHGDTVRLERNSGLPDGQTVSVVLHPQSEQTLDGLRSAFGAWANDPEGVDRFVEETYRLRLVERPETPE